MSFGEKLAALEHSQEVAPDGGIEPEVATYVLTETVNVYESCESSVVARILPDGAVVMAAGAPRVVDGYRMLPIQPNGAVDMAALAPQEIAEGQPENGEIQRPNGAVYSGQVLNGCALGCGKQKWPTGAVYDGVWKNDTMHGEGTLTTPDGAEYVGRWSESRQHGEGKYTAPDRGYYQGQWVAGKMDGKGQYHWPDGALFEGQFTQGEKSGEGILRYANGSKYEGGWTDSKQHGMGVFTTKDGRSRRGEWVDGSRTRWLDDVVPESPKRPPTSTERKSNVTSLEVEMPEAQQSASLLGNSSGLCSRCAKMCVVM